MSGTVIHVGGEAPKFEAYADFLDGRTAVVSRIKLTIDETATGPVLVLVPAELPTRRWPLDDIRTVPDQAGRDSLIVALSGDALSRLVVSDAEAKRVLMARSGKLHKRPTSKSKGRLAAWSLAAVASVALILFVLVPVMADQLAEYLPPEGEKALGDATFNQIRTALADTEHAPLRLCEGAPGRAALDAMQTRLEENTDLPYPLQVHVLDHEMVNAFALPGGRIVFFRGLIDAAETPDEVAAVFAHEIGHVVNRDPARGALRSAGSIGVLGLVLGDFAGGTAVLFLIERLIEATYSQEAEAQADTFAHQTLADAGILPSSLATIFERLRDEHGDAEGIVTHFMAHPSLGDRIDLARAADVRMSAVSRPSLDTEAWQAMRNMCR